MGVKVRERPGKGWYVLTDWNGQRKAKFFGKDKALAKAFAAKLAAKLKWAEQSGEAITLSDERRRDSYGGRLSHRLGEGLCGGALQTLYGLGLSHRARASHHS